MKNYKIALFVLIIGLLLVGAGFRIAALSKKIQSTSNSKATVTCPVCPTCPQKSIIHRPDHLGHGALSLKMGVFNSFDEAKRAEINLFFYIRECLKLEGTWFCHSDIFGKIRVQKVASTGAYFLIISDLDSPTATNLCAFTWVNLEMGPWSNLVNGGSCFVYESWRLEEEYTSLGTPIKKKK